ncbi:MAG: GH3 auxin-responsive promoter family protein [Prevotella sp.]|nr:GH3 auxin-responsive promoter family protein [Prevotella sp.]MCM1074884.1 GH3 auxin-responsive promoter family protein [Ruminococcus sp.]
MIDFTPIVRHRFIRQAGRMEAWRTNARQVQIQTMRSLLQRASDTEIGRKYRFAALAVLPDEELETAYRTTVPIVEYEEIREQTLRMVHGERDVLWPGVCRNFAQSSGTSGGKSKYIPITSDSLRHNHIPGASDVVASYLRLNPQSRIFSGKALILGGSFANELGAEVPKEVKVGDLSATLIDRTPALANLFRIPNKHTALMADWEEKLPAIIKAASKANVTNLSGVPSWFLILLRRMMQEKGVDNLHDIWPGLEVFFHGGISFKPYRAQYESFTDMRKMHFLETYNASEGFFATQTDFADPAMQLLLDRGVYFELCEPSAEGDYADRRANPRGICEVEPGRTYALIISACNGLWRYSLGDTVKVSTSGVGRITIAGRTKSFINAFGEELMEHNADSAMAAACAATGAAVANYSAAPVYAAGGKRGRHRWLIEWTKEPTDTEVFADILDRELQRVNSDYQAKRSGGIFLDRLELITAPAGLFDRWLAANGTGKLGGQRKVPRLSPTPALMNSLLKLFKS